MTKRTGYNTMPPDTFIVEGTVELFPQKGGWYYVRVPPEHTEATVACAERGLVAITVTAGNTTWDSSLMPLGDGTHFIPLSARVRKREAIDLGDVIKLSYCLRER
jgi:hypothetical protein